MTMLIYALIIMHAAFCKGIISAKKFIFSSICSRNRVDKLLATDKKRDTQIDDQKHAIIRPFGHKNIEYLKCMQYSNNQNVFKMCNKCKSTYAKNAILQMIKCVHNVQ